MRTKKYPVQLSEEEVRYLESVVAARKPGSYTGMRAKILLMLDENRHPGMKVAEIMKSLNISGVTVSRVAWLFNKTGLVHTLKPQPNEMRRIKINETVQAQILAIANSPLPKGRTRWTLQMIRDTLLERKVVESISTEGVRRVLKSRFRIPAE